MDTLFEAWYQINPDANMDQNTIDMTLGKNCVKASKKLCSN